MNARSRCSAARSIRSTTATCVSPTTCGGRSRLAEVRLVPAGDPPHRDGPARRRAPIGSRCCDLAVAEFPGLVVDAREIERAGKSYTVLTLEELRREDAGAAAAADVGADAFRGLPTWHRWREVFALAHVVVVARPGVALPTTCRRALAAEWNGSPRPATRPSCFRRRPAPSTRQRDLAAADFGDGDSRATRAGRRRPRSAVRRIAPAAVLAYIDQHRLYSITPATGCDLTSCSKPPSPPSRTSRHATSRSSTSASSPASTTR